MSYDIRSTTLQPQPILFCAGQARMPEIADVLGRLLPNTPSNSWALQRYLPSQWVTI